MTDKVCTIGRWSDGGILGEGGFEPKMTTEKGWSNVVQFEGVKKEEVLNFCIFDAPTFILVQLHCGGLVPVKYLNWSAQMTIEHFGIRGPMNLNSSLLTWVYCF